MGFSQLYIYLNAPIGRVIKNGYANYGVVRRDLDENDVRAVPDELRDDLIDLVKRTRAADEDEGVPCLELDVPDESIENIISALKREHSARRRLAAKAWLAKPDDAWINPDPWPFFNDDELIVEEVRAFSDLAEVAERMEKVKKGAAETTSKRDAAQAGLREYAQALPEYQRAAAEGYDVKDAAVDAYAKAIAAFDEDAITFRVDHEEFKRSQLQERKAPAQYAFEVSDGVSAHLKSLQSPKGIVARVGRIQRFRKAVREDSKWKLSVPVTVVPVWIEPRVTANRVVLFFADAEEKNKYVREQTKTPSFDDDDIPF